MLTLALTFSPAPSGSFSHSYSLAHREDLAALSLLLFRCVNGTLDASASLQLCQIDSCSALSFARTLSVSLIMHTGTNKQTGTLRCHFCCFFLFSSSRSSCIWNGREVTSTEGTKRRKIHRQNQEIVSNKRFEYLTSLILYLSPSLHQTFVFLSLPLLFAIPDPGASYTKTLCEAQGHGGQCNRKSFIFVDS